MDRDLGQMNALGRVMGGAEGWVRRENRGRELGWADSAPGVI